MHQSKPDVSRCPAAATIHAVLRCDGAALRSVEMDIAAFRASLEAPAPQGNLSHALQALWYDAKGDWRTAHEHAQAQDDTVGAWVHAYLHRKEGDLANAGYWYRRAGRPAATDSLEAEWESIATALLGKPG